MPLPWTVGRQKQEQKKLQCSAGWVGYPALTAEEEGEPELGPSKRPRRESEPTSELAASSPPMTPMSVAQAIAGPDSLETKAAVGESPPATVRKSKRKRAAPTYLGDEAESSDERKKSTRRSKKRISVCAKKKKTLTKGKPKGMVGPKTKVRAKGGGRGRKKAAVAVTPLDESDAKDIFIAASALRRVRIPYVSPADATEQAAHAIVLLMRATASLTGGAPGGFDAILRACDDERTEPAPGWSLKQAASGEMVPGQGMARGWGGGVGAGNGSGVGAAGTVTGAAGEAVGSYGGGEVLGDFDDDDEL